MSLMTKMKSIIVGRPEGAVQDVLGECVWPAKENISGRFSTVEPVPPVSIGALSLQALRLPASNLLRFRGTQDGKKIEGLMSFEAYQALKEDFNKQIAENGEIVQIPARNIAGRDVLSIPRAETVIGEGQNDWHDKPTEK